MEEILGRSKNLQTAKRVWKTARWFNPYTAVASVAYNKARGRRAFAGAGPTWDDVLMGAAKKKKKFLPGAAKALKAIGKVTSPITTAAAKAFLPASLVNAAAKLDPTKRGLVTPKAVAAVQSLTASAQAEKTAELEKALKPGAMETQALLKTLTNPKVLAIIAGGAVVLFVMSKKRGR